MPSRYAQAGNVRPDKQALCKERAEKRRPERVEGLDR